MTNNTTFDIRPASPLDPDNLRLGDYAFASTPRTISDEDRQRYLAGREHDRAFFSYLDGEVVAKVALIPMSTNVRGRVVPMGGVSGVASMPAARRGGHIRELLIHAIRDMHERGEHISTLYPFKTEYYEKFGYAGWQAPQWVHINPRALAPYLRAEKFGTIKQRQSDVTIDEFATVLGAYQQSVHGVSLFGRSKQDAQAAANKMWHVTVHEGDEITGGFSYRNDLDKEQMIVDAMHWSTPNAMLNVLDFMARHVDQVQLIRMPMLPHLTPHLWTTYEGSIEIITNDKQSWGPAMGRVISVAGLTGVGAGTGDVTLTVRDEQAPWNNGTFTFSGDGATLEVHEGGEPAGDVTIHGLSALLFSGIDPLLLPIRGWGQIDAAAVEAVRALFPASTPVIHTRF